MKIVPLNKILGRLYLNIPWSFLSFKLRDKIHLKILLLKVENLMLAVSIEFSNCEHVHLGPSDFHRAL